MSVIHLHFPVCSSFLFHTAAVILFSLYSDSVSYIFKQKRKTLFLTAVRNTDEI